MKILRDAVIKERQEKESLNKTKNDLSTEVDRLRVQLQEQEALGLKLKAENADLKDKLQVQRKKTESMAQQGTSSMHESSGGSMLNLSNIFGKKNQDGEYQKLMTEHNYLKKQLEAMLEKLNKAEMGGDQIKREGKKQLEAMQKQLTDRERDLEDKTQAYIKLSRTNDELKQNNQLLENDKTRMQNELNRVRRELDSAVNERDELEKSVREKMIMMNEINEVCKKMEKEIENLSEKLSKITIELEQTELRLQVFDLKKVGKIVDTPAQILMRRNVAGEYLIEVENAGERQVIYPHSIQSFGPIKETEDKFYIELKGENNRVSKDTYISTDRKKVLKQLMTLVKLSQESKDSTTAKKNGIVDKNVFSQVVSFFGS